MLLSIALMGSIVQDSVKANEKVLTTSDLNALADEVRSFVPLDEFDAPPKQESVAGKKFIINTLPWGRSGPRMACFGYPMWSYERDEETLTISSDGRKFDLGAFSPKQGVITTKPVPDIWPDEIRYFASSCARRDLTPYTATNAYGGTHYIEPSMQIITAIADKLPSKLEWPEYFRIQTGGDNARTLVPNLIVQITGTLSDWKPGVALACGVQRHSPTLDSPYDRRLDICLFNGNIDRIALIDLRTLSEIETYYRPDTVAP